MKERRTMSVEGCWRGHLYQKQWNEVGGVHSCRRPTPGKGVHGTGAGELLLPGKDVDDVDWMGGHGAPKGGMQTRHL